MNTGLKRLSKDDKFHRKLHLKRKGRNVKARPREQNKIGTER